MLVGSQSITNLPRHPFDDDLHPSLKENRRCVTIYAGAASTKVRHKQEDRATLRPSSEPDCGLAMVGLM